MRASIIAALIAGLLSGRWAAADIPVGATAPELTAKEWINVDEPLTLSKLHGMVVVLYFWVSFHEGGERLIGFVNAVETNPNLGRKRGVAVIGVTDADRKRTQPMLDKEKIFFPVAAGCDAHKDYQISRFPALVVIDANGKVTYAGLPSSLDDFVKSVLDTVAKTPPTRTHPLDVAGIQTDLKSARDAIREGSYRTAFRHARDAYEAAVQGDALKTLCQDMMDLIEALGRDSLAHVDEHLDKQDFPETVKLLREVARQFKGAEIGRTASQRLGALRKQHPEVAKLLEGQEQENDAREKLYNAQQLLMEKKIGEAYAELQSVTQQHKGTESADAADRIMKRMEKNELMMPAIRDYMASRDCEGWLAQARSYIATRRNLDKAKELLRQIMTKYPQTRYADQAAQELSKLR